MDKNKGMAVVTGASRGIGKEIAAALVKEGYKVVGTCRNPEALEPMQRIPQVDYVPLDLSDKESIDHLIDKLDRVELLVNNAGASQMGPVEEVPMEKIYGLFEIAFFSHTRLIKGIIPKMRKQGKGLIINVTSLAAHLPVPFSSVYAAAKSAMEVLSNGLRNELAPFGIQVVTIAPSFVKTDIHQEKISLPGSAYVKELSKAKSIRDARINTGTSPTKVAEHIMRIIKKRNPAPFYAVGRNSALMALLGKLLPARMVEKNIRKQFKLDL